MAALTPYSAQREEIRRELRNHGVSHVPVKTITDSQGNFIYSSIYIILDACMDNPFQLYNVC